MPSTHDRTILDLVARVAACIEGGAALACSRWRRGPIRHRSRTPMLSELGQLLLRRCAAIGGDGVDHRPIECKQISPRNGGDWLKTSWVAKPGWVVMENLPVGEQDDIKSLEIFQFCPIAFAAGIGGFLELSVAPDRDPW